jgi:hypothetical protein
MMRAILIMAAIMAGAYAIYLVVGDQGGKEFRREKEALKSVKSWKMHMEVSRKGKLIISRDHEANCPDQELIKEEVIQPISEADGGEYLRVGDDVYFKSPYATKWLAAKPPEKLFTPLTSFRPCLTNPAIYAGEGLDGIQEMDAVLQAAIDKGNISKGDLVTVGADQCRNWSATALYEKRLLGFTACISEQDHLPRRYTFANEAITMDYTWNVPVSIERPDPGVIQAAQPLPSPSN